MKFYDYINENKDKKIDIYFDMDGVFAEYDIGNFDYDTIRPISNVIDTMRKLIDDGINVKILSICKNNKIVSEKHIWLDKYLPFFDKENVYLISKELDENKNYESNELKSNFLKNNTNKNNINVLVDDDILIIKKVIKENKNVKVFHVSSIID